MKYIKFESEKTTDIVTSLTPFFIAFVVAIAYPNVLGMFWIIGLVICNFNGFIIPAMMRVAVLK